jgi:hypothetical protein
MEFSHNNGVEAAYDIDTSPVMETKILLLE